MSTAADMALLAAALPPTTVVYRQVCGTLPGSHNWGETGVEVTLPPTRMPDALWEAGHLQWLSLVGVQCCMDLVYLSVDICAAEGPVIPVPGCPQVEPTFAHLDFTWGITARWRVYPPVIRLLRRFS